jgi:hypothetical protein
MTHKLLLYFFPYPGPFGEGFSKGAEDVAHSIAEEPGLLWKIWFENEESHTAGGLYCFEDEQSLAAYRTKHTARLHTFGVTDFTVYAFDANVPLSKITRFPFA